MVFVEEMFEFWVMKWISGLDSLEEQSKKQSLGSTKKTLRKK